MRSIYGHRNNETFRAAGWDHEDSNGKAGFVLRPDQPDDWYWLEDPIPKAELDALEAVGKLDRYIPVDPQGPWGFLDAVNELFRCTGISRPVLERIGARVEWFDKSVLSI